MLILSCAQHIAYAMGSPMKKSVMALAALAANPVEAFVLPATQGVAGVQISAPFCTAPHRVAQPFMYPPWIQKDNLGRTVYDMKDPVGLFHKERVEAFDKAVAVIGALDVNGFNEAVAVIGGLDVNGFNKAVAVIGGLDVNAFNKAVAVIGGLVTQFNSMFHKIEKLLDAELNRRGIDPYAADKTEVDYQDLEKLLDAELKRRGIDPDA